MPILPIVPVFYTDVKKSTTLPDDLVMLDSGMKLEDRHCAVRDVYRKPRHGSSVWKKLNPIVRHMFKAVTKSLSNPSLRLRVRMSLGYGFLYPLTYSKSLRRLTEEEAQGNIGNTTEGISAQDEGTVNTANVISYDYINDYSITIGCGKDATYTLRITIVPKVQRLKDIPSSKLCKPDAPELAGIENLMPDLLNVRELVGQMK